MLWTSRSRGVGRGGRAARLAASRWSGRGLAVLALLLVLPLLPASPMARQGQAKPVDGAGPARPAGLQALALEAPALPERPARGPNADFFGIVGRDPWYEWNTDPARYPNDVNRAALEGMAADLAAAGAGWVRVELRAEHDEQNPEGPGYVDWRKWDWFVKECAPKYGLKVLLLLGSGLLDESSTDPSAAFARINDQADRPDGTNAYIRLYTGRAREVADHFGEDVAAYEILNEPNISEILQGDTDGEMSEFVPERFGTLLAEVYAAIKPAHPGAQLVTGGLLYSPRAAGLGADVDYLWRLYRTARVREYRAASGRYPFDGVAVHTYYIDDPREIVAHLRALHGVMVDAGDPQRLWLTEIGAQAPPPQLDPRYLVADPTDGEAAQARFIGELFPLLLAETRDFVANVFWFKYEDFPYQSGYTGYGLVRLPITTRGAYLQPPSPRKVSYAAYQAAANPAALPTAAESPESRPADGLYFPQTQHAVSGAFRAHWEQNGGLARFGYPLTRVFEVGGLRVQYFERARFEWHPEKADPYKVELGLLTAYLTQGRSFPRAAATSQPPSEPAPAYFPQTGHTLGGEFLTYWQARGGLASFGYPLSEELREVNQADGQAYTVQYFERARLEYHPENAGTEYVVMLGLMGREVLTGGGWYR